MYFDFNWNFKNIFKVILKDLCVSKASKANFGTFCIVSLYLCFSTQCSGCLNKFLRDFFSIHIIQNILYFIFYDHLFI